MDARSRKRDWAFDAGAVLFALGFGVLAFGAMVEATGTDVGLRYDLDFILGVLTCLALLVRRRWPLGFAVAILPIVVFSTMAAGASLVALFGLAVRRPSRVVLWVSAAYVASVPLSVRVQPEAAREDPWLTIGIGVVATVGVVGWGMYVRARHALMASLAERAERAEAEQRLQVDRARAAERARIAREMHDVLGHRLSLLSLHAGALEYANGEAGPSAGVIRENAHQAMEDLRAVVGLLREESEGDADGSGSPQAPQPTLTALPQLLDESRGGGMKLEADLELPDLAAVPEGSGRQAYRIVQEALTNARKHAPGCAVSLRLTGAPGDGVEVEVLNRLPLQHDGVEAGSGLLGVAERAELAGGRVEHGLLGDDSFRLRAWLPWPA